jgi:hypothetical protein
MATEKKFVAAEAQHDDNDDSKVALWFAAKSKRLEERSSSSSSSMIQDSSPAASKYFVVAVVTCIHAMLVWAAYLYDKCPFTTIGTICISWCYFMIHAWHKEQHQQKQPQTTTTTMMNIDVHLSFFLASQLFLAYFSKYDPGKGPHGDGPLSAAHVFRKTNKHVILYSFGEFFATLDQNGIDIATCLELLQSVCLGTWILSLVASWTVPKDQLFVCWKRRLVFSVLALSYIILHGCMAGLNGVSHRFYLAMYSFVALLLEANLPGIQAHPFICLFSGHTFFAAGVSKLVNSDFTWHNGQALCRYIGRDARHQFWGPFCITMAPASLAFELGTPFLLLPVFGFAGKVVYTFLALTFHLAIAILMFPRYTSQSCAYSLLFRTATNAAAAAGGSSHKPPHGIQRILFATLCCILMLTTVFRLDGWPLTAVPMYSSNLPKKFGSTMKEALHAARIVHESKCISDFNNPRSYLYITMEGGRCRDVWSVTTKLGNAKLIKLILLRGLALALACQSNESEQSCATKNYFLDKFSKAVHDECEMDTINYSLILRSKPPRLVPVYSWSSLQQTSVPAVKESAQL